MNRRILLVATIGGFGACLFGYAGRCFGWYWDNVIVPEPMREILIHRGNVPLVHPISLVVKADGMWVRINDRLIPYNEWLERDVYTRARAPMTKGTYRIGT
jgi:hypothetical protein